eukprot:GFYU01019066.1.p1 GENE.GFYU01019066.1~~GFYU01019066.1.p1  ORF type:complete len:1179 (-),score=403.95 GFYU01019066.1:177-3713(-)
MASARLSVMFMCTVGILLLSQAVSGYDCEMESVGDGWCDEFNNKEECKWDGGDCCSLTCNGGPFTCGSNSFHCLDTSVSDDDCRFHNLPPEVVAGQDRKLVVGSGAQLDGSQSKDPEGIPLECKWDVVKRPENSVAVPIASEDSLPNGDGLLASFTPDVPGEWIVSLACVDGCTEIQDSIHLLVRQLVNPGAGGAGLPCDSLNLRPEANAGPDRVETGYLAGRIYVDGGRSQDEDLMRLQYEWNFVKLPTNSSLTDDNITNERNRIASFVPDVVGKYDIQLTVDDGCTKDTGVVRIEVVDYLYAGQVNKCDNNVPLRAGASADQHFDSTTAAANGVYLDVLNYHPDLLYRWHFVNVPSTSVLNEDSILGSTSPIARFTPDAEGTYIVALAVSDGCRVVEDLTRISVGSTVPAGCVQGQEPIANAGANARIVTQLDDTDSTTLVNLDGSKSMELNAVRSEGVFLTFKWSFDSLPANSFLKDNDIISRYTAHAQFVPDTYGWFYLTLEVSDECYTSHDIVQILVIADSNTKCDSHNAAPHIDASVLIFDGAALLTWDYVNDNHTFETKSLNQLRVMLDASNSFDIDTTTLAFSWSFVQVPASSNLTVSDISGHEKDLAHFVPDAYGTYRVKFAMSDGCSSVDDDLDLTLVMPEDTGGGIFEECEGQPAPTANAGVDQNMHTSHLGDATVFLYGIAQSYLTDDTITYEWTFKSLPEGSKLNTIHNVNAAMASFVPDVYGRYKLIFHVSDHCNAAIDEVHIDVTHKQEREKNCEDKNLSPAADAGRPFDYLANTDPLVQLNGANSTDPDTPSSLLSFVWTFISVPEGSSVSNSTLHGRYSVAGSFVPDVDGLYTLEFVVSDGCTASTATTSVSVEFEEVCGATPSTDAGIDITLAKESLGQEITLDASKTTDADTLPADLVYKWALGTIPPTSEITIDDITGIDTLHPTFFPDVIGDFELTLTVSDGCSSSDDSITVHVVEERDCTAGENNSPIVSVEREQAVEVIAGHGDVVTVSAENSHDPDGDLVFFSWSLFVGPAETKVTTETLVDSNKAVFSFTPDVAGDYGFLVKVSDGCNTAEDLVTLTVTVKAPEETTTTETNTATGGDDNGQTLSVRHNSGADVTKTHALGSGASNDGAADVDVSAYAIAVAALAAVALVVAVVYRRSSRPTATVQHQTEIPL